MGFYGHKFSYDTRFPSGTGTGTGTGTVKDDASTISVKDDAPVTTTNFNGDSLFSLRLEDNSIRFEFSKYALWSPGAFNGVILSDAFGTLTEFTRVTLKTNIGGLTQSDLSYGTDKIMIDFAGIKASPTSYITLTVTFNDPIKGNDRDNTLTGNKYANSMSGGKGDDVLIGAAGADKLDGGAGSDTASYSSAAVGVTASLAKPSINTGDAKGDTYISIENLAGSSHADILTGSSAANTISGGGGKDILTGGGGNDVFLFNTKLGTSNIDRITDFAVKSDHIGLDRDIFSGLGTGSTLASSAFYSGTAAHDASDRIIYDAKTGKLFYDADGKGGKAAVEFADIDKGLTKLGAGNFDILG